MIIDNLEVYKKLCKLVLEVDKTTQRFPKHEIFELGSQLRRSSNSSPANLAEGFGNKHTNIFTESISRAQGEIRETIHHLKIAFGKGYIRNIELQEFIKNYEECSKMLYGLEKSLIAHSKQ